MANNSLRQYLQQVGFEPKCGIRHFLPRAVEGSIRYLFTNRDHLTSQQQLSVHQQLVSNKRLYNLIMQNDGNLVLYRTHFGLPLWASNTNGNPVDHTVMQSDGDLVAYSPQGGRYWNTGTGGHPGARVVIQDDGNLVVYDSTNNPLWASNTVQDLSWPTAQYTDGMGYEYVETAEWWKQTCTAFPCFAGLQWPDYATTVVEDNICGHPVVIQLWKGWCEKFLGLQRFPGGVGAEVGVYRRIPGRARPTSLPFLPPALASLILNAISNLADNDLWWAYPELGAQINFTLTNPVTNETFFTAGPETTYWLCKWMNDGSYSKYQQDQGKSNTPFLAVDYQLDYTINGKRYPRW